MQPDPSYEHPFYERLKIGAILPRDIEPALIPHVLRSYAHNAERQGQIKLPDNWDGQVFDVTTKVHTSMWSAEELHVAHGYVLGTDLTSEEIDPEPTTAEAD